jgi:hypothetical protein
MRFGYEMYQINPSTYVIKYGVGGTSMASYWNATTGTLFAGLMDNITLDLALYNLRYVVRQPIDIRGAIFIQGESDCVSGLGASYQTSYLGMVKGFIDRLDNAAYKTDKLRWLDYGVKNGGSAGYTTQDFNDVVSAKQYVMSNFLTDYPSYSSKFKAGIYIDPSSIPLQDTQHYSTIGINTMGLAIFDYFDNYVNEN